MPAGCREQLPACDDAVTTSGAWSGARAASDSDTVSPTDLGGVTYILEATNDNGTTTSLVTIEMTRQVKALAVKAPRRLHLTGKRVTVTTGGLDPGERYMIRIAGRVVEPVKTRDRRSRRVG